MIFIAIQAPTVGVMRSQALVAAVLVILIHLWSHMDTGPSQGEPTQTNKA